MQSGRFLGSFFSFFSLGSSSQSPSNPKAPPTVKNSIESQVINPCDLSFQQSVALGKLIQQTYLNTQQRLLPSGAHSFQFQENESQKAVTMTLKLTRSLLLCPRVNHLSRPNDYHIEILGRIVGKGVYGTVYASLGKLVPQPDGSLKLKKSKHAIKDEALDANWHFPDVLTESEMGRVMMGSKTPILTIVKGKGHAFIVEDFFKGRELAEILKRDRSNSHLSVDQRCHIIQEVLFSAKKMHALGIVHGDIKPSNILVEFLKNNRVRATLIDFNLSKWANNQYAPVAAGAWAYAAPEVQRKEKWDAYSDLYSIAIVAAEIFGAQGPGIDTAKLGYRFKGLFKGCDDLDKQHHSRLKKCIYGLKRGEGIRRYSHDEAMAIIDQIQLERKIRQMSAEVGADVIIATHTKGVQTRAILWFALQHSLLIMENIYRDRFCDLLAGESEALPLEISEKMGDYLTEIQALQTYLTETVVSLADEPAAISIFTEFSRIHFFDEMETKEALRQGIRFVFDDLTCALKMLNDAMQRLHRCVCKIQSNEFEHHHLAAWTIWDAIGNALAKCSDYAFTFDDLAVLAKKLNKSAARIVVRLDQFEEEIKVTLSNHHSAPDADEAVALSQNLNKL